MQKQSPIIQVQKKSNTTLISIPIRERAYRWPDYFALSFLFGAFFFVVGYQFTWLEIIQKDYQPNTPLLMYGLLAFFFLVFVLAIYSLLLQKYGHFQIKIYPKYISFQAQLWKFGYPKQFLRADIRGISLVDAGDIETQSLCFQVQLKGGKIKNIKHWLSQERAEEFYAVVQQEFRAARFRAF